MAPEQRIFGRSLVFPVLLWVLAGAGWAAVWEAAAGERREIAEGRLSVVLPDGWGPSELNAGEVVAGWATQDNRTSLFLREMDTGLGGDMRDLLDHTVANFEASFVVSGVAEPRYGTVPGKAQAWPAIFTTAEATFRKSGRESFEMRLYLFLFDIGERLYLVQASTTKPVREARERQIQEFLRSIVANR